MNPYYEGERARLIKELDACWCDDGRGLPECGDCQKRRDRLEAIDLLAPSFFPKEEPVSKANERQIGGDHYKTPHGMEHWDIVIMFGLDYFQGQITKYVMRHKKKHGLQDLEKAKHFLEKYIESQREEHETKLKAAADTQARAD